MNIVLCADHRFVMPCGVLCCSICYNNNDTDIHIFIITDDSFTEEDKRSIYDIVLRYNKNNQVDFLYVTEEMVKDILQYERRYYTRQTFYRLLMVTLLPKSITKVLYFDCDMIVTGSIIELYETPLGDHYLGAVVDANSGNIKDYNRLQYPSDLGYFNAGMLLVNLDLWRQKDFSTQLFRYLVDYRDRVRLNDQDALNYLARNNKIDLPLKYNVQPAFLYKKEFMSFSIYKYEKELEEARKAPIVIHYAGRGFRPWTKNCMHPFKSAFFKYQDLTVWKNLPLVKEDAPLKMRIKNAMRPFLSKFGICLDLRSMIDYDNVSMQNDNK